MRQPGSIRQLDSSICAQRKLDAYWYYFQNAADFGITSQEEALEKMEQLHFRVNPLRKVCRNTAQIWDFIQSIHEQREELPYEIDGMVIKLNSLPDQASFRFYRKSATLLRPLINFRPRRFRHG